MKKAPRKYKRKEGEQAAHTMAGQQGATLIGGAVTRGGGSGTRGKKKRVGAGANSSGDGPDPSRTVVASNPFDDDQPIQMSHHHQIHQHPPPPHHPHHHPLNTPAGLPPQHYATGGALQASHAVPNHHMHAHHQHQHQHQQHLSPYGPPPPPHSHLQMGGQAPPSMLRGPPPSNIISGGPPSHMFTPTHHMDNHHMQQPMMAPQPPPRPQMYVPGFDGSQSPMNAMQQPYGMSPPPPPQMQRMDQTQPQLMPPGPPPHHHSDTPPQQQMQPPPPKPVEYHHQQQQHQGLPPSQAQPPGQIVAYCFECRQPIYTTDSRSMCRAGCENYYHRQCSGLTKLACELLLREPAAEWACNHCIRSDRQIPYTRPYSHHQEADHRQSVWL